MITTTITNHDGAKSNASPLPRAGKNSKTNSPPANKSAPNPPERKPGESFGITRQDLSETNLRELKEEIVSRTILGEIPTFRLIAELARRDHKTSSRAASTSFLHNCADFFDLTVGQLTSKRRTSDVVRARMISMMVGYRDLPDMSAARVGALFGKDHTSVFYAVQKVKERPAWLSQSIDLASQLNLNKAIKPTRHHA